MFINANSLYIYNKYTLMYSSCIYPCHGTQNLMHKTGTCKGYKDRKGGQFIQGSS